MATVRYHVSEDGMPRKCSAKDPKDCRAKGIDGIEGKAVHFEDPAQAIEYSEKKNAEKYGKTSTISKNSKKENSSSDKSYLDMTDKEKEVFDLEGKEASLRAKLYTANDPKEYREQYKKVKEELNNVKNSSNSSNDKISEMEAEINDLRSRKEGASPEEIKRLNGLIRGKSIHLSRMEKEAAKKNKMKTESTFEEPSFTEAEGYMGTTGWVGNKAPQGYKPLTEIASDMRKDFKDAKASGYLPSDLQYSAKKGAGSSNSINVQITGLPSDREVYDYNIKENPYSNSYELEKKLKPKYQEVLNKANAIHSSYNYDGSNTMVDYFNRGFYGRAEIQDERDVAWEKQEKARNKFSRVVNNLRKEGLSDSDIAKHPEMFKAANEYDKAGKDYDKKTIFNNNLYKMARRTGRIDWNEISRVSELEAKKDTKNRIKELMKWKKLV